MKSRFNMTKLLKQKKLIVIGGVALALILIPVSVFLLNGSNDLRSDAAANRQVTLEAERGDISGNATRVNDNKASGRSYVRFGSATITPAPGSTKNPTPTPTAGTTKTPTPSATKAPTPSPTKTSTPTPTTLPATGSPASALGGLANWKLTLPIGNSGKPTEIKHPTLASYVLSPWFVTNSNGGVRFRAPVTAVTTSGSNYPRSELREMKAGTSGKENASWSSTSGVHTMTIDQAITSVPKGKKHVVAGQIHDAGDDVIVIRLEYPKLFIDINRTDGPVLDEDYALGRRFTVTFEVKNGQTRIYYNGKIVMNGRQEFVLNKNYSGAYFKAGAYTQSNCVKELEKDKNGNRVYPDGDCSENSYGEVIIYSLDVKHQ